MQVLRKKFTALLRYRFTVMLVPHKAEKVVNFHISFLGIVLVMLLFTSILVAFFVTTANFIGSEELVQEKSQALEEAEANLEVVLDELSDFIKVSELFSTTLSGILDEVDIQQDSSNQTENAFLSGDLISFRDMYQSAMNEPQQLQSLKTLADQLRTSIKPLEEVKSMLVTQRDLLTALPNKWPVLHSQGRVTMEFGPNIHPFTGQWYLHKGFDISAPYGIPIVASADGKVVDLGYDPDYGLNVWIRHRYGFRTHYSHLQSISVTEGQEVTQGQRIGTLGNTGISTGAHLDYQIWIGTEVVDPAAFLKISNTFTRWTGNR